MHESDGVLPDGRLQLATEVALPDPLDVLVVGGGPAGTAAAFRARELGLSALVIELDDLLSRIRDYDKDKPIKPDFGAGRQMRFPRGGDLIGQLHFFTDVRGSDLCEAWKALYRRHSVPAQIGVELVGLEPGDDGVWGARVRNHRSEEDGLVRARHVVLALGAGTPRRLDVPGDVRAIGYRLADPRRYLGAAACVIGGGVSAAEAVIAISEAKAAAADDTPVYWSHRRPETPNVPYALQASMERATTVNRNVRLLPGSEAQEVSTTDADPLLRLQVAGARAAEAANAGKLLEFQASHVIACIGQEIDWKLLEGAGIFHVTSGAHVRKAIPLTALLECRQPNVYVIGDTLNPAYLECEDFDGDVSGFQKVAHRGNIKASLTDGVKVAGVIAQRLAGKTAIRIDLDFVGAASVPPAAGDAPHAVLTRLLDGAVEAEQFELHPDRDTTIGRRGSDVCFEDDARLADRHAAIVPHGTGYRLRDGGSPGGVFLHLADGRERVVPPGTVARVGRQWLMFGSAHDPFRVAHHDARGRLVKRYKLSQGTQIIGRAAPDITLETDDRGLSRRHLSVIVVGPGVFVRDLNSVNGTYLKVDGSCELADGDVIRAGCQVLRYSLVGVESRAEARVVRRRTADGAAPAGVPAAAESLAITFGNRGASCPFRKGQTICEVAEAGGVELVADCHAGICGSDPVRIVSGRQHLNPLSGAERETLDEICGVEPGVHRLACMVRPTGPVVVEIVDG